MDSGLVHAGQLLPRFRKDSDGYGRRVLILDDDSDFADVLEWSLKKSLPRARFDKATNYFEVLNKMSEKKYDFLVFDWKLQETNCWSALSLVDRHLNMDPTIPWQWAAGKVPVVVVSAENLENSPLMPLDHFEYAGYIDKRTGLTDVVRHLSRKICETTPHADSVSEMKPRLEQFMSSLSGQLRLC